MSGLLLIGAMPRELRGAARALGLAVPGRGAVLGEGDRILCCGVGGGDLAAASVAALRPERVLHVGFAGALRAGITEGDLLVVTSVIGDEDEWACDGVEALRSGLARLPRRLAQGALATVPGFLHEPDDKRALGARSGAAACEMEAAPIAAMCHALGIPYCGVRAISDALDRRLLPSPRVSKRAFARELMHGAGPFRAAAMLHGARRAEQALSEGIPVAIEALRG